MGDNLTELTADIVSAYVEHNSVPASDLPALIKSTYGALSGIGEPVVVEPEAVTKPTAAQIKKSITPDALISFIDGKPYKMLKRHLTTLGLTAKGYRERFGLPSGYPMTAPSYSAARSALATKIGLGRKAVPESAPEPVGAPVKAAKAPVEAKVAAKPAKTPRASKAAPVAGEKAGPGAMVPKAKVGRPPKAIDPATDEFT